MKNIQYLMITFLLAFASCTKDFEEINTNPNAPNAVEPALLLRQVIYDYGEQMSYEGFVAGNLLGQYFTMVDFNLFDRHSLSDPQLGGNPWPVIYANLLDNEKLLELSRSSSSYSVYEGPALILKAYMTAALTDLYGDIPYSEALRGEQGLVTPAYDSQEDIYTASGGILDNLEQGIDRLESYHGNFALEGDILYEGDLSGWLGFAQSLQVKYLMRISGVQDVSTLLQTVHEQGQYLQNNQRNACFDFSNEQPNSFRMQQLRDGDFNLFIMSETAQAILSELEDPRMEVFFRPAGNDPDTYTGLQNGPDASATSISVADYSLPGTIFREHTGDLQANFMTSWETLFLLAEAAERGFIAADTKSLYEQAVQQAFEYWNTEMPSNYLSGAAAFDAENSSPLEQIITQKWIANTINGYEGWNEYRRTGFPDLRPVSASLNSDQMPKRMPYPTDEATLNANNYQAFVTNQGTTINTPVWWDN